MAHALTNIDVYPKSGVFQRLGAWFERTIDRMGENHPRLRQARALQALSDADLAARGIKRQDIVRHVFRDVYYM